MATPSRRQRPVRALTTLAALVVLLFGSLLAGTRWSEASMTPELALDLEGGTQIILTPVVEGDEEVTEEIITQSIEIIRQRVDASGVAEAEITSQGGTNIVVALPGRPSEETLDLVRESAQMLFRPVLAVTGPAPVESVDAPADGTEAADGAEGEGVEPPAEGEAAEAPADGEAAEAPADGAAQDGSTDAEQPAAAAPDVAPATEPTDASDPAWLTEGILAELEARDCTDPANLRGGSALVGDPDAAVVACDASGTAKYVLGPVEVRGEDVESANSGLRVGPSGVVTNEWVTNIDFDSQGTRDFREVTTRLVGLEPPRNQFAMVLDGLVIVAPVINSPITDGNAEISGGFTRESAATLARQLNFGALPLSFEVQSEQQISATLGSEQLQKGLIAGVIGLALVALYSIVQYRALGLLTVASLLVAGIVTYGLITLLSWTQGYRLSLPGVAGLIVAIGITADSFIVYFERIKDELRDGRTLVASVEEGWRRARRTIIASDFVSFLAAVVLYVLAVGGVRGFAFTLGLITLVDLLVVFMFTHPVMALLARTGFFGKGHRLSGLDPRLLTARTRYAGRGKVALAGQPAGARPVTAPAAEPAPAAERAPAADTAREPVVVRAGSGTRTTIAERRAAERRAREASATTDGPTDAKDA